MLINFFYYCSDLEYHRLFRRSSLFIKCLVTKWILIEIFYTHLSLCSSIYSPSFPLADWLITVSTYNAYHYSIFLFINQARNKWFVFVFTTRYNCSFCLFEQRHFTVYRFINLSLSITISQYKWNTGNQSIDSGDSEVDISNNIPMNKNNHHISRELSFLSVLYKCMYSKKETTLGV